MSITGTTAGRLEEVAGLADLRARPLSGFPHGAGIACGRATMLLASDRGAVIREVEEYVPLAPWTGAAGHWEVVYVHDPDLEEEIRRAASATGDTGYAKRDLSYHRADLSGGARLLSSDESFGKHRHSMVRDGRWVAVVDAADTEQTRRGPLRVVRELMLRGLENRGGCFTHAAGVETGGVTCLLVGGNGSGKTSVMWHLVLSGAGYVSNDRCVLLREEGALHVFVYPMSIRLGMGTVAASGAAALRGRALRRSQAPGLWGQRFGGEDDAIRNWGNRDKLELTPRELADLTGARVSLDGRVGAVLIPRLEIGGGPIRLAPVPEGAARATLEANLREPVDEDFLRGYLGVRRVSDAFLGECKERVLESLLALPRRLVAGDPRALERAAPTLLAELSELVRGAAEGER